MWLAKGLPVKIVSLIKRLLVAVAGPMGVSVAHMGVALVLLSGVPAAEFGQYAFLQVIIAFGFGLSNAVFISPLTVMLNREAKNEMGLLPSYLGANFILCAGAGVLMVLVGVLLGNEWQTASWFGVAATLIWWRWFARGVMLAEHRKSGVLVSDSAYTVTLVALTTLAWSLDWLGAKEFLMMQSVAGVVGLMLLEGRFWQAQWAARYFTWAPFVDGFERHARYSLVSVTSSEATINSQAYFITALLGPAAFAPVAAANLIFRPSSMVILALMQAERPALSQALKENSHRLVRGVMSFTLGGMVLAFVGNALLAIGVVGWGASYLLHEPLPTGLLEIAVVLVGVRAVISCIRSPASLILQADGKFKPLALATVYSSLMTLPLVFFGTWFGGVVWALVAALIGDIISTILLVAYAKKKVALFHV